MKEETIKYPGFRWFVAITYIIVIISSALVLISITPLMGEVAKSIGQDVGVTAGIVMSTFNLLVALGAIAGGPLIDRFGVICVWFGCLALLILGQLLTPVLGNSATGMTVLRIIQGAGTGPIMGSCAALAAQWFPIKERGILTGMQGLAMGAGVAIGTILGPVLTNLTGNWQTGLTCEAGVTVGALIMTIIVAIGPKPPVTDVKSSESEHLGDMAKEVKTAILQPATISALICAFGLAWIFQAMGDLTPSYLAIDPPVGLGKGALLAGSIYSVFSFAYMIGAVGSQFFTDKVFKGSTRSTILVGFIVSAVTVFGLKFSGIVSVQSMLLIDLVISGLFMSMIQPQVNAFIAMNYPEHLVGKVGGTIYGLSVFGGVGGATVGAYCLHATGNYLMGLNVIAIVCIIGTFGTIFLKPPKTYKSVSDEFTVNLKE